MPDPASVERPWVAHYPPGVPPTYRYPDVPVTRFLDDAARDFPTTTATQFRGAELDYRRLREKVDRFAGALAGLGVGPGDRVAIVLPNLPAAVIATFAALRIGAVVVPGNPGEVDEELARQLDHSGARVAVVLSETIPRLAALRERLPSLQHLVATSAVEWLPRRRRLLAPARDRGSRGRSKRLPDGDGIASFRDLIEQATPVRGQAPVARDDLALLQYTGGTTGTPKAVALTHGNLVANAFQARLWVPDIQAGKERLLAVLPFFHVYGMTLGMLTAVLSAASLVLLPRFDVDEVLDTIDTYRPTLFPGVPRMYRDIAQHPKVARHELGSIRACVCGAASLPADVARRFEEVTGGARLREGYGLSECSPLTHANPIYGRSEHGRIGLPVTDTVAIVVDPDDATVRRELGEPGELAVAGPQVMHGYWRPEAETPAVLRDGWLLTGDIAVQHEDGTFTLLERKKDVVIAGGVNVYPRDVESALLRHPGVAEAVALGLPDADRGETVKGYVTLRAGSPGVTGGELVEHCRQHLAGYKVPTEVEVCAELPQSATGKVLRRDLRRRELAERAGTASPGDAAGMVGDPAAAGDCEEAAG